ncbi:MAG TPA: ABC transporter ATP-binding protein [Candidatus Limnocylindria bacterium]|nr:ABC transporter ATP-binding protein [Candidatus Limnocylindria bacterium]
MQDRSVKLVAKNVLIEYWLERSRSVFTAVQGVDLEIHDGEFVAIVGPSGCGKTTFLNAVDGLLPIGGGSLKLEGKDISKPGPDRAMVFQQPGLLPWRTVLGNVIFGVEAQRRMPRDEAAAKAKQQIDLVGLGGFEDAYPGELSGGMQQRVNLARALLTDPQILLLDEPFAALDAQTREILQEELLALMERPDERKTMVFITHSIDEAIVLGDRITVMSARPGRIKEVLDMPFGWPRNADAVRSDPRFTEFRLHIWHELHTAKPARLRAPREVA